ncbi:phosphoglycolate phosphatase [Methanolobus sp. ZRKC3]|uniref:phosphoglycolate phosphatase n=1 Tax=Methanolobus sp. ZRKC3 TaxID=3125786 RepID=UPI003248B51E
MKFKALAIDIDGTITHADRSLSLEAVAKLRTLDVPVVLATGNILCYAKAASKLIGVCCNIIAENGGIVTTGFDSEPLVSDEIGECQKAFDFLSGKFELTKLDPLHRRTEIVLKKDFDFDGAKKILEAQDFDVEIIDTHFAIHIKSSRINKGTGLIEISKLMGLKVSDFVAIGDSINDVELLETAGLAVAVGNADDFVKDIADYVAESSYGDGTAEAIDHLLSKGLL